MNNLHHNSGGGGVASYIDATQPPQPLLRNRCATPTQPLIERYENALHRIPTPGTGCHAALLGCANLGIMAGINEHTLLADIRAAIPTAGRRVPDGEILDAIRKAQADVSPIGDNVANGQQTHHRPAPAVKPPFDGPAYRRKLIAQGDGAEEADFMELSGGMLPLEPAQDAVYLLETLYAPSDILYTGDVYGKQVDTVHAILERVKCGSIPSHIVPNPMTGQQALDKSGNPSFRCDAAVSQYRFAVVEFDDLDRPSQLAFWHSIITRNLMPVACLIDSGNKSVHAWLDVNLPDAQAWQREIREGLYHPITGRMACIGADRACQNPARLSRMPGHRRDNGRLQQLVYVNPNLQVTR